jgi:hypothetical protein
MTTSDQQQFRQHAKTRKRVNYSRVVGLEDEGCSERYSGDEDENAIQNCDHVVSRAEASNFELEKGIDYGAVDELVGDINELRKGLLVLLLIFVIVSGLIAVDDYYSNKRIANINDRTEHIATEVRGVSDPPHPHRGHKLQINASAFTVNDFECLNLDTGNWPSERVHCELRASSVGDTNSSENDGDDVAWYDFVVEHFDDENCQEPNADNPIVRHTSSGCFYFEGYNHSYNDLCHANRTFTISAFYGPGCVNPMPVTAVNVLPED